MSEINVPTNFLPLKLPKKDFLQYKEELEKFFSVRKDEYKNLFESFDILKQKKLHLSFLLFSYYNSWIFPYISYNKITRGNIFSSTFEISFIFKKLSKDMKCPFDEKVFILWYFYIYYNYFIKVANVNGNINILINQIRYILFETGKIVISLFEKKLLSINSIINILDMNLLCYEYFIVNPSFANLTLKNQKSRKLLFFLNYFNLLKKIAVITLKTNNGFDSILTYLDKIKNNQELNDEMNIFMLLNNNILQDFMKEIFDNMDVLELRKTIPDFGKKLNEFYINFLKNKYKISKIYDFFVDTLRCSFEHLYNFKQNKNIIIRDIFKNNFNFGMLNRLYNMNLRDSINIEYLNQLNSLFYFDTKKSNITFENTKKMSLDQTIILFSFRIDDKIDTTKNPELPLLSITNKNTKKVLKIYLKNFEKDAYKLLISPQKEEISDLFVYKNNTYYCAFYIHNSGKKMKIFLRWPTIKSDIEENKKEIQIEHLKNDIYDFCLGKDEKNNFIKGNIGPFIIATILDSKGNKDIDKHILEILSLCENYRDFIIIKSDLSHRYSLKLKDYFGDKYYENLKKMEKIKGNFECLLYLNPETILFYKNKMFLDENSTSSQPKKVPLMYDFINQNNNYEFVITNLNVSIFYDETLKKLFKFDNGINFFALVFEYYDQFLNYYLLKKEKDKIFEENEFQFIKKDLIESIKNVLLIFGNHLTSPYIYIFSKKVLNNLYKCLLDLNRLEPIIDQFYFELNSLVGLCQEAMLHNSKNDPDCKKNDSILENSNGKKGYENDNKINYVKCNISYFIGIIEILFTPDFYNNKEKNNISLFTEKLISPIFKRFHDSKGMLELSSIQNIFYKLLGFIPLLNNYFIKEKNDEAKYQSMVEEIFRFLIDFINENINENNFNLAYKYFNDLFLFVFGNNRHDYYIILAYLRILEIKDEEKSSKKINLKFSYQEIIELRNFLFGLDSDKDKENENEIKNTINVDDKIKKEIQNLIIYKIYEYLFINEKKDDTIKINFLEEFLIGNKLTNDLFIKIQNLLQKYFVNILRNEGDINNPILNLNNFELNSYFQRIFEFLKFFTKYLHEAINKKDNKDSKVNEDKNALIQYLNNLYAIMLEAIKYIELQSQSSLRYILLFILNYLLFIYSSSNDSEYEFLISDGKVSKIINELFEKCIEFSLIHCDYYLLLKDERNATSSIQDKKLISEIFFDIYSKRLEKIFDIYRLPENNDNQVDKEEINFLNDLCLIIDKKIISEFNFQLYDVKKLPYIENLNSIYFLSDFFYLLKEKKFAKKYAKIKDSFLTDFEKKLKEIISSCKLDFLDLNIKFEYYHTTYYFYRVYDLSNRINSYINHEELKKHENLKQCLEMIKSSLMNLKKIILNDHLKLNLICKDYYFRKYQINDSNIKNMLKSIQVVIFNKKLKNIEKIDLVNSVETEFTTNEIKSRKDTSVNSRGSGGSDGSNPNNQKRCTNSTGSKDSGDGNQSKISEISVSPEIIFENSNFNPVNEGNILNEGNPNDNYERNENYNKNFSDQSLLKEFEKKLNDSYTKNILDKLDKFTVINPKKELMKTIFSTYFSKSFYENETFKKLKMSFLNTFIESNPDTKILNFPSKIKNFVNGLEPSSFLKENNKFFISKMFPISHKYFYNYMLNNHILNESIILLNNNSSLSKNLDKTDSDTFNCELIKSDKIYYGQIINSKSDKLLFFTREEYELFDIKKDSDSIIQEIKERGFCLSSLVHLDTENTKKAKENAKNDYLDKDLFPKEDFNYKKTVIIFYDEIEEIIERRILYKWQGLEIFLKNGKSYMINMLAKENYEKLSESLKKIPNIVFRDKDFFQKAPVITQFWRDKKMDTYEYLLYLNKYSSRSYNDVSQYYIFPWILKDFSNLFEINNKVAEILEYKKKQKNKNIEENNENGETETEEKNDKKLVELSKNFRDFKYPVSAQEPHHRNLKKDKYNDEEEKFKAHHGTHYSTSSYIDYYLMRNEPFTSLLIELQNYAQEDPNRLLLRLKDTINIINTGYDNRELIPELFSKIDYFPNINCCFYGVKKNKELVDDIDLTWENNKEKKYNKITIYCQFIIAHKKLLNSDVIALTINKWIDNIFGCLQIPSEKKIENSINIFPKSTYEKYTDLNNKLEKLSIKYKNQSDKIVKKFTNKINVIISFGQCPHQIFSEKIKPRYEIRQNANNNDENSENYGLQNDYLGTDFLDTYMLEEMKNDNSTNMCKNTGIYFEVNPTIEKVFILGETNEITIIDTNFYDYQNPKKYNWAYYFDVKLPTICTFNKIKMKNNNYYYIYNLKYAFSSFPSKESNSLMQLYANNYLNEIQNNKNAINKYEKFKIITCRHIDNSFKLHTITLNTKKKKHKETETCTHICEDFVMCCKAFSDNEFIIGLRNGKLIKAKIHEFNDINEKHKTKPIAKYDIIFDKYITGHMGSINVLEVDTRYGIVITGGDDNKLFIRKLYDFELLTSITFKSKFVITMAKVSPINLLYVICFNRNNGKSIIFGYSLSGLKFAKSNYSHYSSLDFTRSGNVISLINASKLKLLNGHNLREIKPNEEDKDYKKFFNVKQSFYSNSDTIGWVQFNDFKKYYGIDRSVISYTTKEQNKKEFNFRTLKVTNISYFE